MRPGMLADRTNLSRGQGAGKLAPVGRKRITSAQSVPRPVPCPPSCSCWRKTGPARVWRARRRQRGRGGLRRPHHRRSDRHLLEPGGAGPDDRRAGHAGGVSAWRRARLSVKRDPPSPRPAPSPRRPPDTARPHAPISLELPGPQGTLRRRRRRHRPKSLPPPGPGGLHAVVPARLLRNHLRHGEAAHPLSRRGGWTCATSRWCRRWPFRIGSDLRIGVAPGFLFSTAPRLGVRRGTAARGLPRRVPRR